VPLRWPDDHDTVEPATTDDLRAWFAVNHASADGVWILYWRVGSGRASISWSQAVDEALCVGWIDTKIQPIDAERYVQYFTPRRAGSMWSRINKGKVDRLAVEGRMHPAGRAVIDRAIADGSWTLLDAAEALVVTDELQQAMVDHPGAGATYAALSNTGKKNLLRWIYTAKREATRTQRIAAAAAALADGRSPRPT
jgi:uncharacterized protein YdeI (YjbR/CyaY-like superfamily)